MTVGLLIAIAYLMVGHAKVVKDLSESPLNAPMWASQPTLKMKLFLTALWPIRWREPFSSFKLRWWRVAGDLYQWAATFAVLIMWFWVFGMLFQSLLLRLGLAYIVTTVTSIVWAPIAGLLSLLLLAAGGAATASSRTGSDRGRDT